MRFEASSESGAVRVSLGDDVALEARNFRRRDGHEVRLFVGAKLVHGDRLELGRAEARAMFAAAAAARLAGDNGAGTPDLSRGLLALDHAVQHAEAARRGQRPADARPRIDVGDLDLPHLAEAAWSALEVANDPPSLFRVGGVPSRLELTPGAPALLRPLTVDRLRYAVARAATWHRAGSPALPPEPVVRDLLARPDPPLPRLDRLVGAPVFAPDGGLMTTAGYHAAARVYCDLGELSVPAIPDAPTDEDIARQVATLTVPIADFPFVSDTERAHAFALELLPFVRAMIPGPTPLHLFEKPTPRTGASLLVAALTLPALGRPAAVMTAAREGDEWRRRITATLLASPSVVVLDNLHALDSEHLSAVLTAWPYWRDRRLGVSEIVEVQNLAAWAATGNNPALSHEMAGRVVRCRLDARMDRPGERTDYRIPQLLDWVSTHRGELVHALLTLGRAWLARGRPAGRATLSGFEAWSACTGGILAVAKIDGFLANVRDVYAVADVEGAETRRLFALWWDRFGDRDVGVADVFPLADKADFALKGTTERAQRTSLGTRLTRLRDCRYTLETPSGPVKMYLELAGTQQNAARWQLRAAGAEKGSLRFTGSPPETPQPPEAGEPGEPW